MLSLIAVAAAATSFQGGSPAELAKNIAEATKSNVLIESGPGVHVKSFVYEESSLDEMARVILKEASLRRAPGMDNVFHHPGLPAWEFELEAVRNLIRDSDRQGGASALPANAIENGLVTLRSEKRTGYSLAGIESLKTSKPLAIDPFFQRLSISAWVTAQPERDFLNALAKTVGGVVRTTKDGFSIEPNGMEVQRRALATIDEVKRHIGYAKLSAQHKAELELSRTMISSSPHLQLAQLASAGTPIRMEIGPALRSAVGPYLQSLMDPGPQEEARFGPPNPPSQQRNREQPASAERFRSLDRRLLGYATLSKGFKVSLELATVGEFGRPGPLMRVP